MIMLRLQDEQHSSFTLKNHVNIAFKIYTLFNCIEGFGLSKVKKYSLRTYIIFLTTSTFVYMVIIIKINPS